MTWLAARLGESRIAQAALCAVVLGGLLVLAGRYAPDQMRIVSPDDVAHANALYDSWLTASRAERCERPALREPITGDGRGDYAEFVAPFEPARKTPLAPCRDALWKVRDEIEAIAKCKRAPCPLTPLGRLRPHPDVVERCAGVLDVIERHAHTTRSCSPIAPELAISTLMPAYSLFDIPRLVRLQIAPLVLQGRLAEAARDVTNAMQFVTDYGRNGALVSLIEGRAAADHLARTLEELLDDPRLPADDARVIARDLDIVFAAPEPFDHVMRAEILATTSLPDFDLTSDAGMTHDRWQDRALMILAHERWLATYQRICEDAALAVCATKLRAIHAVAPADGGADFEPILHSSWDPDVVRERVLDQLVGIRQLFDVYAQKLVDGDARFAALRAKAAARAAQP